LFNIIVDFALQFSFNAVRLDHLLKCLDIKRLFLVLLAKVADEAVHTVDFIGQTDTTDHLDED
jgi:hypothetical protein